MRQELRLVRRHIDVHGTLALASLAGETEIKCVFDVLVSPPALQWIALEHLEKQVCASAGRVCFFPRGPVARTHRPALMASAFANTDAAKGREREAAMI